MKRREFQSPYRSRYICHPASTVSRFEPVPRVTHICDRLNSLERAVYGFHTFRLVSAPQLLTNWYACAYWWLPVAPVRGETSELCGRPPACACATLRCGSGATSAPLLS